MIPAPLDPPPPSWPPPPHDARERVRLLSVEGWEVRVFAESDPKHAYFAARGLLHLQLWEPRSGVSILTPSRLTCGRFEAFPIEGWKRAAPDYATIAALIRLAHGVAAPSSATVLTLMRWYLRPAEVSRLS